MMAIFRLNWPPLREELRIKDIGNTQIYTTNLKFIEFFKIK